MKLKLLAVVAVGVCLLLAAAAVQGADKEEVSYAKVEVKGIFVLESLPSAKTPTPKVSVPPDEYKLDLNALPGAKDLEKWKKMVGETVILKGTLYFMRTPAGKGTALIPVIHVTSIRKADTM